jgi:cytochrome bd-type quinol oxidase subunit 2
MTMLAPDEYPDAPDAPDDPHEYEYDDADVDRPFPWTTLAFALTALVVVPAVLLHVYLLLWFLPEADGYSCFDDEPSSCHHEVATAVYWWLLLAAVVVAAAALVMSWLRRRRDETWWRWPVVAFATVPVCVLLSFGLVG